MERRLKSRHNIPMKAIVTFDDTTSHEYETLNVSGDGAFLITDKAKPIGTKVLISLIMESVLKNQDKEKTAITVEGTINRCTSHGMAVCFDRRQYFSGIRSG